jgi:hypothetical protein
VATVVTGAWWSRHMPRCGSLLLVVMILPLLAFCRNASADTLSVSFDILPSGVVCQQSGTPTNGSVTCTVPTQSASAMESASGFADYGSLGASGQITSAVGQVYVSTFFQQDISWNGTGTVVCPTTTPGLANCPAGDIKTFDPGTTLTAALYFSLIGSWSYDTGAYAYIEPEIGAAVNGVTVLSTGTTYNQVCSDFFPGPACGQGTHTAPVSATLVSTPFTFVVGTDDSWSAAFNLLVQCSGSCNGNFLDPTLTDIEISDPTTGLPVQGISVTGDNGTVYPVNVAEAISAPVPEPATLTLTALGLAGVATRYRRRFRSAR